MSKRLKISVVEIVSSLTIVTLLRECMAWLTASGFFLMTSSLQEDDARDRFNFLLRLIFVCSKENVKRTYLPQFLRLRMIHVPEIDGTCLRMTHALNAALICLHGFVFSFARPE